VIDILAPVHELRVASAALPALLNYDNGGVAPNRALPAKDCAACGRTIRWRKKWERDWENVRWCSDACRRRGVSPTDTALAAAICEVLAARARTATICPSEAAKHLGVTAGVS
jgi:hypothetical protein